MLKLSRTTFLLLIAGVFIIASAGLGIFRSQQVDEQNQLSDKLVQTQASLSRIKPEQLSSRQTELESQLSLAISQFEAVKAVLSKPVVSTSAIGTLFDVANASGVEVTEMTSPGSSSEELEGITCSVISLTVKVEGDAPSLVDFLTKLNSLFTTGLVRSVTITVPEATGEGRASANFQLVVYYHQD
ncbi:hypothetical protein ACFLWI_06165 [Chloroflexota bacterium]